MVMDKDEQPQVQLQSMQVIKLKGESVLIPQVQLDSGDLPRGIFTHQTFPMSVDKTCI